MSDINSNAVAGLHVSAVALPFLLCFIVERWSILFVRPQWVVDNLECAGSTDLCVFLHLLTASDYKHKVGRMNAR